MKNQTTQIQSKAFSRKAKSPAQDRKIAAEMIRVEKLVQAAKQEAEAAKVAPVAPVAPKKYAIVNGVFTLI